MSLDWFVLLDGKEQGPYSTAEIFNMKNSGLICSTDKVKKSDFPDWVLLREIPELVLRDEEPVDLDSKIEAVEEAGSGRRAFLKKHAIPGLSLAIYAAIWQATTKGTETLVAKIGDSIDSPKYNSNIIENFFGGLLRRSSLVPGTHHYLYRSRYHPDDEFAARTGNKIFEDLLVDTAFMSDRTPPADLDGTIICTGGHVSNGLSRLSLEYRPIDKNDPTKGYIRSVNPIFAHRWEIVSDKARLLRHGITKSVDRGHGEVPNWSIFDHETGKYISPDIKYGELQSDYMLITALPNIYHPESYSAGHKIFSFGGTHGVATRALNLLLGNEAIKGICTSVR